MVYNDFLHFVTHWRHLNLKGNIFAPLNAKSVTQSLKCYTYYMILIIANSKYYYHLHTATQFYNEYTYSMY